ncbi:MAG: hypothetical protein KGJ84_03310 [Elusimicrobia bacterium]|nr:hypothetical protein [Elusimicrobiota bacterium]
MNNRHASLPFQVRKIFGSCANFGGLMNLGCSRSVRAARPAKRRGPGTSRTGASVFLALSLLLPGPAARGAEFEISASSFTVDNQVNRSSVTYYGGMTAAPAGPSITQLPNTPGGLYFDGTRYRVWDNPAGAWVSLTTGTVNGLLPWSELTSYPGACSGNQVVTGVGAALTCTTPSGTLSGGTAGYYGEWTGAAAMGVGNLVDGGAGVTLIAGSTLTVSGNAFSVGGSTLVVTGGSVGVGTTGPAASLEVDANASGGGAQVWALFVSTNQSHGTVAPGLGFGGTSGVATIQTFTNAALALNPNGGNVGIGTTAPTRPLHVVSAGQAAYFGSAAGAGLVFQDNSGVADILGINSANNTFNPIEFHTGVSPALYVDTAGKIGVGTTSPASTMTVAGSIGLNGVGAPPVAPAGTGRMYFDSGVNKLKISENGGAFVNLIGGAGGAVTLQAATPGVADSGNLNITGAGLFGGKVGVGTAVPSQKLDVQGGNINIGAGGNLSQQNVAVLRLSDNVNTVVNPIASGGGVYLNWDSGTTGTIFGSGAGGEVARMTAGGLLGVGTNSPAARLHVSSANAVASDALLEVSSGTGAGQELLTVKGDGKVGIGTASPTSMLSVEDSVPGSYTGAYVKNTGGSAPATLTRFSIGQRNNESVGMLLQFQHDDGGALVLNRKIGGYLLLSTTGGGITIDSAGNAGVGTTSPAATLHVSSAATSGTALLMEVSSGTAAGQQLMVVQANGSVGVGTASPGAKLDVQDTSATDSYSLRAGTSTTAYHLVVSTTGNVGIGTASPTRALHVLSTSGLNTLLENNGTGNAVLEIKSDQNAQRAINFLDSAGAAVSQISVLGGTNGISSMTFLTSGLQRMKIDENGNVGIGTTSPASTMTVAGSIGLTGVGAPPAAPAGTGRFYFDSGVNKLKLSENGGAYVNLIGGAGGAVTLQATTPGVADSGHLNITGTGLFGGNVGIGTTGPAGKLEVNGPTYFDDYLILRNSSLSQNSALGRGAAIITGANDNDFGIRSNAKLYLASNNSAAPVMTVDTTGNVGIGTTTPLGKLSVMGSNDQTLGLQIGNAGQGGNPWYIGREGISTGRLAIGNGITEAVSVLTSGNVGIGTSNPGYRLENSGNNATTGIGDVSLVGITNQNTTANNTIGLGFGQANLSGTIQTVASLDLVGVSHTVGAQSGALAFGTRNAGTWGERLRIDNSGNVGIGTASPGAKLDVQDTSAADSYSLRAGTSTTAYHLVVSTTGNVGIGTTNPGARLQTECDEGGNCIRIHGIGNYEPVLDLSSSTPNTGLQVLRDTSLANFWAVKTVTPGLSLGLFTDNTASRGIYIQTGGNVGIGTTSPSQKLDVRTAANSVDGAHIQAGDSHFLDLRASMSSGANNGIVQTGDAGIIYSSGTMGTGAFVIAPWAGSTSGIRMDASGNVGIGTTNPGAKLDVQDTSATDSYSLRAGTSTTAYHLVVSTTGNVGIGTTSPGARLDVIGPLQVSGGNVFATIANSAQLSYETGLAAGRLIAFGPNGTTAGQLNLTVANSIGGQQSNMVLNAAGNVGIGTTSPGYRLDVQGGSISNNSNLRVAGDDVWAPCPGNCDGGQLWITGVTNPNNTLALGFDTTNNFGFIRATTRGTGVRNLVLQPDGANVGIGTTGPDAKLTVNGSGSEGTLLAHITHGGLADVALFYEVAAYAPNGAAAAMKIGQNSVTGRSINAGGTINASGADYAEWIPWPGPHPEPGTLVRYKRTWLVVSSTRTAGVTGNDKYGEKDAILVSFAGQVPVRVKGRVREGDYILPDADGTGVAVGADGATFTQYKRAIGKAWESSETDGVKKINVAVGLR